MDILLGLIGIIVIIGFWRTIFEHDEAHFWIYVILACGISWKWGFKGFLIITLLLLIISSVIGNLDDYDDEDYKSAKEHLSKGNYSAALESIDTAIKHCGYDSDSEIRTYLSFKAQCCKYLDKWQQAYEIYDLLLELTSDEDCYEEEREEYQYYREEARKNMKKEQYIKNLYNRNK